MNERETARVERISLVGIGVILLLFAGRWAGVIPAHWIPVFLLVLLLMLLSGLFWWAWVDRRLRQGKAASRAKRGRWLRWLWAGYVLAMASPIPLFLAGGRSVWDSYPVAVIMWILFWHMLMVLIGVVWAVASGLYWPWRRLRRRDAVTAASDDPPGLSRRDFLVGAVAAAPVIITGGAVAFGKHQEGRFLVRHVDVRLPRLPDRLRGLTITHISDMHVGRLFRPEHLPRMVDAANRLNSDLLVVTGDMVDHSVDFIAPACEAVRQIASRYGRFMVIGNHDLIDSPQAAVDYLVQQGPSFLFDRTLPLLIDGETIQITGLFWSRYDEPQGRDPGHVGRARAALYSADMTRFTLALAHHPHAFDALAERGVDLTLSGHTHGGQLMLTPPGSRVPIGGGSLLFRYIWGEYRRGDSVLQVTSGVGNWFPVRVNAPAEMVQYRLV